MVTLAGGWGYPSDWTDGVILQTGQNVATEFPIWKEKQKEGITGVG